MKKLITFLMLLTVFGVSSVWANEVTFNQTNVNTAQGENAWSSIKTPKSGTYTYSVDYSSLNYLFTGTDSKQVSADGSSLKFQNGTGVTISGSSDENKKNARQTFTYTTQNEVLTAESNRYLNNWDSFTAGTYNSAFIENNLEFYAKSDKTISIATSGTHTVGGESFTGSSYLSGGDNYIHFKVAANSKITIYSNVADNNRTLNIAQGSKGGTLLASESNNVLSAFSPEASDIFVYTSNSGAHIYGIKVEPTLSEFEFNPDEVLYYKDITTREFINSTTFEQNATYDYLRLKLKIDPDFASLTNPSFSVTSSNAEVLDASAANVYKATNKRLYVDNIQVKGTGTATLTFTFNGADNYAGPASCEQSFTVTAATPPTISMSTPATTTDVAVNTSIVLTTDRTVTAVGENITGKLGDSDITFTLTNGNTLTYTPASNLANATTYSVKINANQIQGTNGAQNTEETFSFTTVAAAGSLTAVSDKVWNFSDWTNQQYTSGIVENIEVITSSEVSVDGSNKTFTDDDATAADNLGTLKFTKRFKTSGTSAGSDRLLHFKATKGTTIQIVASSQSSDERTLYLCTDAYNIPNNKVAELQVDGSALKKLKFTYTGDTDEDFYIGTSGGIGIYYIKVSSNFTVDISKLMMPVGINANRDINRTIPRVTLTFGGGDGIKFNATDKFIIRNEGTFNVALRKSSDDAKINSIVLHGDFSKYTKADINDNITASSGTIVKTDNNTLTWTAASGGADDVTFTSVEVSGVSATISSFDVTTNGKALDDSKVTPTFAFSPASATASTAASGSYTTTLTSSPGFFNAVTFNAGVTGTTLKGTDFIYGTPNTKYTLTSGTTAGSARLTASFAGNDYFNPVSATTYTLTVSDGKAELTDFSFNKDEATYTGTSGTIYVNSKELTNAGTNADPFTFVYDASRSTLKTKFFLDPSLTTIGASANTTYFTVISSDDKVLDVSNVSVSATNNGTRLYFDGIKVLKAGTATLTYKFLGSDTYNAKDVDVAFTVESPITTYSGSYPYTWNFKNETSWTSSSIQSAYHNSIWVKDGNAVHPTETTIPANNGIDKIQGLSFTVADANNLWLNWGSSNKIWLNGTVTIPSLSPDYIVNVYAETKKKITVGETPLTETSGVYTYTPTATGDVIITANCDIYKIEVTRGAYTAEYTANKSAGEIDGKIRNLSGTWEFTGAGSCATGTIIKDVPGIEVKFNKGTTELNVTNVSTDNRYKGLVLMAKDNTDHNATIEFTPYVNGFLSLQGNFYSDTHLNDGASDTWSASVNTYYQSMTEINVPLIAGKTYTLSSTGNYSWEFHGFTFRPAFLVVDSSTGNLTNTEASKDSENPFAANMNLAKNRFPHLITTAGEGKVKFAGDRKIVNLEGDNDVVLIDNGNTIIKGTVLLEGSDEELFTYYYLQSTILNLSALSATKFNGTDIADQAYVDDNSNATDIYTFTFSTNIEKVSDDAAYKVYLRTDAGDETDITAKTTVPDSDTPGTDITVKFNNGELVDGSTYRIRIAAGGIKASDDAAVTNAEIVRTFSIKKSDELQLTLKYPTSVANVGTSIVIEADKVLKDNDNNYKGSGCLKKDGTDKVIAVTFKISGERLIAKPNETLENNTGYTLIIDANSIIEKDGSNKVLTKSKAFSITTGASAGTQAAVVSTYPVNDPKGNIPLPVAFYNGGRISVTFDQAVELEPYSTVYATPVNGSESLTATTALSGEDASLKVDSDGKTVYWEFNSDYLKYDLYYDIRIPANTVVASGGKPNALEITFRFRMPKNPNATAVDPDEFYPHTWDFCKFGDGTEGTSAYTIIHNAADKTSEMYKTKNALYKSTSSDGYTTYTTDNGYDQGNDVYVATSPSTKSTLPEFKGIRISLVSERSNRFEIRDVKSKNLDGTNKYIFRMNGNTHYMTLSNVPKGKLYMVVNSKLLGINSPNAKFANLPDGVDSESNTKITNTKGIKKLVVEVEEAGDVIFCVGDFSCEKIGVAVDYKKALSSFENYFTDCQEPEMRYDLTGEFTSTSLTAYYVDGTKFTKGQTTINFTPLTNNVALAGEGTIIKASTEDTNIPIFCADVNTTATAHTTSLVGVLENTYIERIDGDKRNYFFTNIAGKVDPESGLPVGEFTSSPLGFYRAVASTLGAHKSYLQLPLNQTNARSIIYINFDGEGETTGIRNLDNNATVQQEGAYYTLTGIRLNGKPSVKGIYILNGKKVMIK